MNTSGNRPPLTFHTVCGKNVRIQKQDRIAERTECFCKGLAFSARPIETNEIVVMKLTKTTTNCWGVLRFGVTNTNPEKLQHSLPKYAIPDLTNKERNWAKELTERYCQQGNLLHFYVLNNGELHYGINGVQKGLHLSGINSALPMWVLVDIYGKCNCVEFTDPSEVSALRISTSRPGSSGTITQAAIPPTVANRLPPPNYGNQHRTVSANGLPPLRTTAPSNTPQQRAVTAGNHGGHRGGGVVRPQHQHAPACQYQHPPARPAPNLNLVPRKIRQIPDLLHVVAKIRANVPFAWLTNAIARCTFVVIFACATNAL